MKLPRRQFLHLIAGAAALPFAPHVARAPSDDRGFALGPSNFGNPS
jgi:hypothetical protein